MSRSIWRRSSCWLRKRRSRLGGDGAQELADALAIFVRPDRHPQNVPAGGAPADIPLIAARCERCIHRVSVLPQDERVVTGVNEHRGTWHLLNQNLRADGAEVGAAD